MQLVEIAAIIPDAIIDLRYASADNFVGRVLYKESDQVARLTLTVAEALKRAADVLQEHDLRLVIWDAYRPPEVQQQLRDINSDDQYVALESNHCMGRAVDVTVVEANGSYLDLGTDF